MIKISSVELWANLRGFILDQIIVKCRTDELLVSEMERVIDHVDQDIKAGKPFSHRLEQVYKVLTSPDYHENSLRRASQTEHDLVRDLASRIGSLLAVARKEIPTSSEVEEVVSQRLPNRPTDVRDMYEPISE